jgi:FkbM family methyltransferase
VRRSAWKVAGSPGKFRSCITACGKGLFDNTQNVKSAMQKLKGLKFLAGFANFWDLAVRRLTAKYPDISIYDLASGPTILDRGSGDTNSIWACLDWGEYNAALAALPTRLKQGRPISVLDCGANAGGFGILLANRGFSLRQYHAVEMNPRAFGRAAFNLTNWRGQTPARLFNAAVAEKSGWIDIEDSYGDTGQSIYSPNHDAAAPKISVQKITIQSLLSEDAWPGGAPELIKLDVEGAEFDIIPQLDAEMLRGTAALIAEIHPVRGRPAQSLVSSMEALGFTCSLRPHGDWGVYVFCRHADVVCGETTPT